MRLSAGSKVLDFGLAKLMLADEEGDAREAVTQDAAADLVSRPGAIAGTAAYVSPEQVTGRKLDARSDVKVELLQLKDELGIRHEDTVVVSEEACARLVSLATESRHQAGDFIRPASGAEDNPPSPRRRGGNNHSGSIPAPRPSRPTALI